MGPSGLGISPGSVREATWDDLTTVPTITELSRHRFELWSLGAPEILTLTNQKYISQLSTKKKGRGDFSTLNMRGVLQPRARLSQRRKLALESTENRRRSSCEGAA